MNKQIYKKWWFWLVICILFFMVIGSTNSNNTTPKSPDSKSSSSSSVDYKAELQKSLKDRVNMDSPTSVRNDKTGKWKLSRYASSESQDKIAVEYYNAFFNSDDEIHYLINFSTNTTARITKISDDKLEVYITEYVEKEEHDAALIGGGMGLSQNFVTISTGEIEKILEE